MLDPVGVMSSALRLNFALKLLKGGYVNIVRGNYDECRALADEKQPGTEWTAFCRLMKVKNCRLPKL